MTDFKYKIGDQLYYPIWTSTTSYVECPDCGGTGRIRVIFHDETVVSIECQNCRSGFNSSGGKVQVYDRTPKTRLVKIVGIGIGSNGITYKCDTHHIVKEEELFKTHEEALEVAKEKAKLANEEDLKKVQTKHDNSKSWAWNASYHRRNIKELKEKIEYHTKKLNVASLKAKEKVE